MCWFSPWFSGDLVNATDLTLLLESFAGKAIQSRRFSYHCQIFALFLFRSFTLFIAPDGIADFGIAQAKHCNLVFCSFVLRIGWLKPFLMAHAITCGANGLTWIASYVCSVATGVSLVNIRLSPSSTSDNIRFLHYSFIQAKSVVLKVSTPQYPEIKFSSIWIPFFNSLITKKM